MENLVKKAKSGDSGAFAQLIRMNTHDDEIAQVADRILVIEDGQVVDFR